MNWFKKLSEKRLIRKVKKLRENSGEPIEVNLHQSVLYKADAFRIFCRYIAITQTNLPQDFLLESENVRFVLGANNDEQCYWYYCLNDLYYTILIGKESKLSIGKRICSPYRASACFAYFEIPLMNCRWQLSEKAQLYAYFMTGEEDLEPLALMLRGEDIADIDSSVWGIKVDYRERKYHLEGYDGRGRKGEFYNVWLPPISCRVVRTWEEAQYLPLSAQKESWWRGEKIIRQFDKDEKPSLQDMLAIWNVFRKSV